MKRLLFVFALTIVVLGCKKEETPDPPESVQLIFPERNSECNTGVDINANTSEVEFRWQASNNTDSYELIVTNLNNGNKQDVTVAVTTAKLPIAKGTPFSWQVISKSASVPQTASSPTWNFYNSGFDTTYAPFPADLMQPKSGASVAKDSNSEVLFVWSGADVDGDITSYELYFSTTNPPEELVFTSNNATTTETELSVEADTVYYWKVITIDSEGNSSSSVVFDFKVI